LNDAPLKSKGKTYMTPYRFRIKPLSAFGTRPLGDTLFGQMCWALRNRHGEARLAELLTGYTEGRPYAVVSDALPAGHWPRPALPGHWYTMDSEDRKAVKQRAWLPAGEFALDPERSYYQPFTRFGRHGDLGVHLPGGPFKAPVLLARTGAVFAPLPRDQGPSFSSPLPLGEGPGVRDFIGQGLGGDGTLSKTITGTIHQGYAPVVGIRLPPQPGKTA
jgi:hypothetical protein